MAVSVRAFVTVLALATTHAFIDEVVDVIHFGKEIGEEVINSWDILGKAFNATPGVDLPLVKRKEKLVLSRLAQISRAIQRLELGLEKTGAVAMLLAKTGGRGARLELRLHELADLLSRVATADRQMREYMRIQQALERSTLEDFAAWCVSHDPGALPGLLERVHSLIVPPHKHLLGRGLFELVLEDLEEDHPDLCELQLSPHQLIYDIYNTISLSEIKGYAMMQFSWMLLRIYGKGNYTQEASLTRERYGERSARTATAARAALNLAKRDVYRCDPAVHREGESYTEVTRLLQGYIENEVDLNSDGTCRENCAYYTVSEYHECNAKPFCERQPPCSGRVLNCQYIDSDMWVCPASRSSNRRYEWIEYENGRTLGRTGACTRGTTKEVTFAVNFAEPRVNMRVSPGRFLVAVVILALLLLYVPLRRSGFLLGPVLQPLGRNIRRQEQQVDSWWKWNLLHCSYCMCLCEENVDTSERSFSLMEASADISKNKVVTGVRLVKHGRVFHLQVSEGTLGERGFVTPSGWVPIQKFDISDGNVKDGEDYHTLTYERRAIDLDELDSPLGHILTGIRFRMIGAHLHFEIRSTPFNYTTGRLSPDRSQWISNDNTEGTDVPRSKLELVRPDIPTRSSSPLPVDSKHDQYVEFTHSDFDADAAQSTVPFIDIQPVAPMKGAALLSGAGVIHRGARGSGGFVALKAFTYDYSKHVLASLPPRDIEDEPADFMPPIN